MIVYRYKNEIGKIREVIKRPVADVEIRGRNGNWYWVTAYIDSGADISIIPYSLGLSMGFEIERNKIIELIGVTGKEIPVVMIKTRIKFSEDIIRDVEIGWALVEAVPILLGTYLHTFHLSILRRHL
jgi:hypothetical protein